MTGAVTRDTTSVRNLRSLSLSSAGVYKHTQPFVQYDSLLTDAMLHDSVQSLGRAAGGRRKESTQRQCCQLHVTTQALSSNANP